MVGGGGTSSDSLVLLSLLDCRDRVLIVFLATACGDDLARLATWLRATLTWEEVATDRVSSSRSSWEMHDDIRDDKSVRMLRLPPPTWRT